MKKFFCVFLLTLLCGLPLICACKSDKYTIEYYANEGGVVYGALNQTVEAGEDCTQVYAVAEAGYRFIGWSDGVKTSQRLDTEVKESVTITAQFEKIEYIKVKYTVSEGGNVFGELTQTIEAGEDCSQVHAVAEAGYRFIGWSDGVKSSQRLDTEVKESVTITAQFEDIKVLFYSDGYLVRDYTLNEFKTIDISRILGYASFKDFLGWEFIDEYAGYNCEDPLKLIKSYLTNRSDLTDITLNAKYSDITEITSIPVNSKTIAHALGGVNKKNYLNSKEAFEANYKKGARFFEADVSLTTDNVIVLDHARGQYTYEEFMNLGSDGYTPLSLKDLLDYMTQYPEIWVDLDTLGFSVNEGEIFISSLKQLINNYDVEILGRIIIEMTPWNDALIELLKNEIGITNFLYTESWYTNDLTEFEKTCQKCFDNGIKYVSIVNDPRWAITEAKVDLCHKYGIYVMAYTVNLPEVMYDLYDIGVDCIFTDYSII